MNEEKRARTVLMLCHDQHLDRRVVAQAQSLIATGHKVTLVALSFGPEGSREITPEGIDLVRIGLANIIPENPVYQGYIGRQHGLNALLNRLANRMPAHLRIFNAGFRYASRINWELYRATLLLTYRNRSLHDPLPFRSAFVNSAAELEGDVIQVHDLPALEAGVELASKRNVPLVYDAHELYPEQKSFSTIQRKICSEAEARLIKHADLVFAVNESIGLEMAKRYAIDTPATLLNAIDPPPSFDPDARYDLLREKTGLGKNRRILLFQGGFAPNRNLENLVKSFAAVETPDIDLVMMGFGPFGEVLQDIARKHGVLDRRVFFLPAVPQSELLQHSASADMGIIPYPHVDLNSYYCTPNKLFEFIQAGLPILANQSPELDRFVVQQGFGVARPMHRAKDIALAVDYAFSRQEISDWKTRLLSHRLNFTWQTQSASYLEAMRPVIEAAEATDQLRDDRQVIS
ncbi:glycosyltransferase [Thauera sp. Sel9]|uniref:glycosyltransferase n=1 Tax=Thauera sp. Sel9 TaxID=2974299 RepID=UPI0021E118B8|nr:glycosyltransferase [Thauera sp. Sel9]MCV2218234.1 glycosyltransferase [Thauera sp. Sel9]